MAQKSLDTVAIIATEYDISKEIGIQEILKEYISKNLKESFVNMTGDLHSFNAVA